MLIYERVCVVRQLAHALAFNPACPCLHAELLEGGWWTDAVHLLTAHSGDKGDDVCRHIKVRLQAGRQAGRQVGRLGSRLRREWVLMHYLQYNMPGCTESSL
jgi:hypothetical protein